MNLVDITTLPRIPQTQYLRNSPPKSSRKILWVIFGSICENGE
uniref:Uncharacterized protein n=1 Tax=Megaselia scalaris TaxID=36166 RepID=T1GJS0_MEGSC